MSFSTPLIDTLDEPLPPDSEAVRHALSARIATMPAQWVAGLPLGLDAHGVYGRYFKGEIRSQFSPYKIGLANLVRGETLATGPNGEPLSRDKLYQLPAGADGILKLDRLCRLIHTLNHFLIGGRPGPLVLPIHPLLFQHVKTAHGKTFAKLMAHFELAPRNIILEIPQGLPDAVIAGYLSEGFTVHMI
ncbi:hypothetical protein KSF73_14245 [Burkholderiaceae bacterium DAT-1]|nr:hypothetical protein [Burkholderiaceae bacterium DAT-1]